MNLVIDIGNTRTKLGIFNNGSLLSTVILKELSVKKLEAIIRKNNDIENVFLCSVKNYPVKCKEYLTKNYRFRELSNRTKLPFKNKYLDIKSLGKDRLADVAGAVHLFPGKNILAVDAGTCITYNFIDEDGNYLGGGISPGMEMRFKALHTFTKALPLIKPDEEFSELIGRNTMESIRAGVQHGILMEIKNIIRAYRQRYSGMMVIISGGIHAWIEDHLDEKFYPEPFLTLKGLNVLLEHSLPKGSHSDKAGRKG